MPLEQSLEKQLKGIVGNDWVISDPGRLLAYESDGLTAYRMPPVAVVLPMDTDEVSRVLQLLSKEGVPVVPRGAGTGLSGGALAGEGCVEGYVQILAGRDLGYPHAGPTIGGFHEARVTSFVLNESCGLLGAPLEIPAPEHARKSRLRGLRLSRRG